MKIYSKSNFVAGLFCLVAFLVAALKIVEGDWTYKLITLAGAAKFLYTGLTKSGSERAKHMDAHYDRTARKLHGKNYKLKANLPLIVLGGFVAVGLALKVLDVWMPGWFIAVFVLALVVSTAYSIGLHRDITEYIDEYIPQEEEMEP